MKQFLIEISINLEVICSLLNVFKLFKLIILVIRLMISTTLHSHLLNASLDNKFYLL